MHSRPHTMHDQAGAWCGLDAAEAAYRMRRSPQEEVYSSAHSTRDLVGARCDLHAAEAAHRMRRSPLEDVYSSAHCMYAALVVSTPSSCATCTANALSGSTCDRLQRREQSACAGA